MGEEITLPELPPVHIDIERMGRALAGPRMTMPQGMTAEEIGLFFDQLSAMINYAVAEERERCAKLCEEIESAADDCWDLTADPASQGESIGAVKCAAAIRAQTKEQT